MLVTGFRGYLKIDEDFDERSCAHFVLKFIVTEHTLTQRIVLKTLLHNYQRYNVFFNFKQKKNNYVYLVPDLRYTFFYY